MNTGKAVRHHDPERLANLAEHGVLDTRPEPEFDRMTRLAGRFTQAPVCLLSLVDSCRQFFKSAVGLPSPWAERRETPLSHSFCVAVVERHAPLVIEDARVHPDWSGNPAIQDLGVVAYLGVPLTSDEGFALGSLCVIDHRPRKWTEDEIQVVTDLAGAVMTELRLRGLLARQVASNTALTVARTEAEEALRVRGEFLSRFSHELRTPLAAVIGYAEILQAELAESGRSEWSDYAGHVSVAGNHLLELVNDILDFARIDAGVLDLRSEDVDVAGLLRDVQLTIGPAAMRNGNRLEAVVPDRLPRLRSDPVRLRQILINLLGNAAKFTREGTITLEVKVEMMDGREQVSFAVRDTGIGMTQEQLGRLFQPFVQATREIGATYGGSGLGLAISRRYARAMGGDILVRSEPGVGTEFRFAIPV